MVLSLDNEKALILRSFFINSPQFPRKPQKFQKAMFYGNNF